MYSIMSESYVDGAGNLFFDVSFRENDVLIQKRVSVQDYISLLSRVEMKDSFVNVPLLPTSIIKSQISTSNENTFKALVFFKAEKRPFIFMDQHLVIPFPALIAYVEVNKGTRVGTRLFALASDEVTEDTPLWRYPFGNVDIDGSCCFGNIKVNDLENVSHAPRILEMFLYGKTNNDYYDEGLYGMKQSEMVEFLVKKDTFPNELLKPSIMGTVGSLMKLSN